MNYQLIRANRKEAFRTEEGLLLVPCLFISLEDDSFHTLYMREQRIEIDGIYEGIYKPTKGNKYKLTFNRKES
jgi:hypothetical protein